MDNTTIHPRCTDQAHHVDLHLWRGAPQNLDADRPIQIMVNQGFVVGFCPDRLQPAWSAYRVAHADQDVDYDRPLHYYDDMRLDDSLRIGKGTFGKLGGIQLHVGHMTPNEVVNRQFGRLAQMETFLMSNMSPQYGSLNTGVWLELENAIRNIEDGPGKDHVWVIVGPIFGDQPVAINRGQGKHLPVPDAYFCITVDPFRYPYDTLSKVHLDCFIIPQDAARDTSPADYPATLEEIEQATKLKFFASWGRELPVGAMEQQDETPSQSRLMQQLMIQRQTREQEDATIAPARPVADTIDGLIAALVDEVHAIQAVREQKTLHHQGRPLTDLENARLITIQHTLSWLMRARQITEEAAPKEEPSNLITYKIASDTGDRLKTGARTACNFWNRFISPKHSVVIRLGIFTRNSRTIARAYKPYSKDGVQYGRVEFNTKYLRNFTDAEIAGTIIHEIGHTLGIGWDDWKTLFDRRTGAFHEDAIAKLPALAAMEVERDGGSGTALSHWDERIYDRELMTGYKDSGEHVLPVTIDVMALLGHKVAETLAESTMLDDLMQDAANVVFSQQEHVRTLDLDHLEETEVFEELPHRD